MPVINTDTGWVYPGTVTSGGGGSVAWQDVANATDPDGDYAKAVNVSEEMTNFLIATNFNLASHVPVGATVTGFKFKLNRGQDATGFTLVDNAVSAYHGGSQVGDNRQGEYLPADDWITGSEVEYGDDANDDWNVSGFDRDMVIDSTFGIGVQPRQDDPIDTEARVVSMAVKIFYSAEVSDSKFLPFYN